MRVQFTPNDGSDPLFIDVKELNPESCSPLQQVLLLAASVVLVARDLASEAAGVAIDRENDDIFDAEFENTVVNVARSRGGAARDDILGYKMLYHQILFKINSFLAKESIDWASFEGVLGEEFGQLHEFFPKIANDLNPLDPRETNAFNVYDGISYTPYIDRLKKYCQLNGKKYFPPLIWLPQYKIANLPLDIIAGITVGIFVVPQGMAYALLAGLPTYIGLYAFVIPALVYVLFGTSRQLSVGPFALVAILVQGAIEKVFPPGSDPPLPDVLQLSVDLMLYCGIVLILFGLLRLGFVVNFMGKPFLQGFTSAAGIIIQTSQLRPFFGELGGRESAWYDSVGAFFARLPTTNWRTFVMGWCCLLIGIVCTWINKKHPLRIKGSKFPVPYAIIIVVFATLASWQLDLQRYGVKVVGTIPPGFPPISVPGFTHFGDVFIDAVVIALVSYLISSTIAQQFAEEHKYETDNNQEMLALGLANVGGSFFTGFVASGAMSRSVVANASGARSPVYSFVAAGVVILVLMVLTPLLFHLPNTSLAAIIIVAAYGLWAFESLPEMWRQRKADFVVWWITFLCVLFIGISTGLLISLGFSIILVVYKASQPHVAVLGRLPGTTSYRNIKKFPEALVVPGIVTFRFDADLFFANANYFRQAAKAAIKNHPAEVRALIFDMSAVNEVDYSAILSLRKFLKHLQKEDIEFFLCNITGPARAVLVNSGFIKLVGAENCFWSIHGAMRHAKKCVPKEPEGRHVSRSKLSMMRESSLNQGAQYERIFDTETAHKDVPKTVREKVFGPKQPKLSKDVQVVPLDFVVDEEEPEKDQEELVEIEREESEDKSEEHGTANDPANDPGEIL